MILVTQLQFKVRPTLPAPPIRPPWGQVAPAVATVELVKVKGGEIRKPSIAQPAQESSVNSSLGDRCGKLNQRIVDNIDLGNSH